MIEAKLEIDRSALAISVDAGVRLVLTLARQSVAEQTRGLEKDLEGITRVAVRGRLYRAWQSEVYPNGISRVPTGVVWVNGDDRSQGAIKFFTESGRVTQKEGAFFAIPTPEAGPRGRRRDLTPRQWALRTGLKLRFVYQSDGPSWLVIDNAVRSGKAGIAKGNTARRRAKGRKDETIIIFKLIPHFDKQNRFSIKPLVQRREKRLADDFQQKISNSQALK